MKKAKKILMVSLCLLLTGCNTEYAKEEYDSNESIASTGDHYSKASSVFNLTDNEYSLTVSNFDGRETLWTNTLEDDQDTEIDFSLCLSKGQAKVVHVDENGNVTTIMECSHKSSVEDVVTETVSLKAGVNRLKLVGYDCEDVELKMLFEDSELVNSDTIKTDLKDKKRRKKK
ncbi:MAG: hypothetical protein ACI4HI_16555 [Lachnospiraceae bacterium]